jgi:hypothetical protein
VSANSRVQTELELYMEEPNIRHSHCYRFAASFELSLLQAWSPAWCCLIPGHSHCRLVAICVIMLNISVVLWASEANIYLCNLICDCYLLGCYLEIFLRLCISIWHAFEHCIMPLMCLKFCKCCYLMSLLCRPDGCSSGRVTHRVRAWVRSYTHW